MNLSWKKIKEEKYKAGYRKLVKRTFLLPNGVEANYDLLDDGNDLCILALTPDNKVVLSKVFRPGPEKVLLEMPAGMLHEGEDPKKKADDELLEETGYKGKMEFIGTLIHDAYSNKIRYCFVAKNCVKIQEPTTTEEDEKFVEVVEMSVSDFRKHLKSGELTDVEVGYLALDYLDLL